MRICLACADFCQGKRDPAQSGARKFLCETCGGEAISDSRPGRERLIRRRMEQQLEDWGKRGVLDGVTAARLRLELEQAPAPPRAESSDERPAVERQRREREQRQLREREEKAREETEKAQREAAEKAQRERQEKKRREREERQLREREREREEKAAAEAAERAEASPESSPKKSEKSESSGDDHTGVAVESGQALFRGRGIGGGLELLSALDDDGRGEPSEALASLREFVWWFIGALLVLAGSIMGVREAWLTLAGAARQIMVAGALLAYHSGFVGLAALVGRKSTRVAAILGGIATAILPVVFVALASLAAQEPWLAVMATAPTLGVAWLTLRLTGRMFAIDPPSRLPLLLLPTLLAELPLAALAASSRLRAALPFVGLALLAAATRPSFSDAAGVPFAGLMVALIYASGAVLIFALVGFPDANALDPGLFNGLTSVELSLWVVSLAVALALAVQRQAPRERYPRAAPAAEILGLAVALCAGLGAALTVLTPDAAIGQVAVALATVALAGALFHLAERRHPSALHLGVLALAALGALLARLVSAQPAWWATGSMLAPTGALLLSAVREGRPRRHLVAWGVFLGCTLVALVAQKETALVPAGRPWLATATAAAMLAMAAYIRGRKWPALDYLGGAATLAAAVAYWLPLSAPQGLLCLAAIFLAAALGFGALGWLGQRKLAEPALLPFDDLSLFCALLSALSAYGAAPTVTSFVLTPPWQPAVARRPLELLLLASLFLLLRTLRDGSRAVSFCAFATLAAALVAASGATGMGQLALVLAAFSLTALLATAVGRALPWIPSAATPSEPARRLLGSVPLPWSEATRGLFLDGLAAASLGALGLAAGLLGSWLGRRVELERSWAIDAGLLLIATALGGFLTPGWAFVRLRGSLLTLSLAGGLVGLTAVVNRIGRPLPPMVVGRNLTVILALVWLAAVGLRRIGPWLGRRLESEAAGPYYHIVPLVGVGALGALLGLDAWLVGSPGATPSLYIVPPMFMVGAALGSFLLARSTSSLWPFNLGLLLLLPAAALGFAQRALLGPTLIPLVPPGSHWVRPGTEAMTRLRFLRDPSAFLLPPETLARLWERAGLGLAILACALALLGWLVLRNRTRVAALLLGEDSPEVANELLGAVGIWLLITCASVMLLMANQPRVLPAVLIIAAGCTLFLPPSLPARAWLDWFAALSVLMLLHGIAHLGATVPGWIGPALALAAVGLTAVRGGGRSGLVLAAAALIYALATGGAPDRDAALVSLLASFGAGLIGGWTQSLSLPATLLVLAGGSLAAALSHESEAPAKAGALGFTATALLTLAGLSALVVLWPLTGITGSRAAAVAMLCASLATLVHIVNRSQLGQRFAGTALGARWGRDGLLLGAGAAIALVVRSPSSGEPTVLQLGLATLVLGAMVSAHAAYCERTTRHMYLVQVALVGLYALLRTQFLSALPVQVDACFALVLGFLLVGVTAAARRAKLPPLALATRRFAALLPVGVALLLPDRTSGSAALLAGGSSLLYVTLAAVENSKLLGALGALAANLALLIAALSYGIRGSEIYLTPLGLLILMLAQIFKSTLGDGGRRFLQVVGGLCIYLPSAIELSGRLGDADSGQYAVLFGGLCLLGVALGMVLRIRAYLVLGTLFLALDVVVNLLNIGLRNHRIGFWLLSLTGLLILGGMLLTTLRTEETLRLTKRLRAIWRRWD